MSSSEETELKHLCEQLDETLDDFFRTLKELLNARQDLDKFLKEGYFLMARARYSMGAKSVTSTQYNPDDLQKAFSYVSVLSGPDGNISFLPDISSLKARACAPGRNSQLFGPLDKSDSEFVELDQIGCNISKLGQEQNTDLQSGLRHRNLPKDPAKAGSASDGSSTENVSSPSVEDLASGMERINCEAEEPEIQNASEPLNCSEACKQYGKDPLLWFGVLVPQPLRQSQVAFKHAIELSCRVSTLQQRLIWCQASYKEMMTRKSQLVTVLCRMSAAVSADDEKVEGKEVLVIDAPNALPEYHDIEEAAS